MFGDPAGSRACPTGPARRGAGGQGCRACPAARAPPQRSMRPNRPTVRPSDRAGSPSLALARVRRPRDGLAVRRLDPGRWGHRARPRRAVERARRPTVGLGRAAERVEPTRAPVAEAAGDRGWNGTAMRSTCRSPDVSGPRPARRAGPAPPAPVSRSPRPGPCRRRHRHARSRPRGGPAATISAADTAPGETEKPPCTPRPRQPASRCAATRSTFARWRTRGQRPAHRMADDAVPAKPVLGRDGVAGTRGRLTLTPIGPVRRECRDERIRPRCPRP